MIHNVENPYSLNYISVSSDSYRGNEVMDEEETRLHRYCNYLEVAVLVCEVLTAATLALCAFVI